MTLTLNHFAMNMEHSTFCSSTNPNISEETTNNSQKLEYKYCTNEPIKSGESKFKVFSCEPAIKNDYDTQKCIDFWKLAESRTDLQPAKGYSMKKCPPKKMPQPEVVQGVTVKDALEFVRQKGLVKLAMQSRKQCKMCVLENPKINYGDDFVVDDRCFSMQELDDFKKIYYDNAEVQTDPIYTKARSAQVSYLPHPSLEKKNLIMQQFEQFENALANEKSGLPGKDNLCICKSKECTCSISTDKTSQYSSPTKADKCTCSCDLTECLCTQLFEIVRSSDAANEELARLSKWEIEQCPCSETACACLKDYELIMQTQLDIEELVMAKVASGGSREKCVCSCGQEKCPCQILIDLHNKIDEIIIGHEEHLLEATPPYAVDKCECEDYCTCLDYYKQVIEDNIRKKNENLSSLCVSSISPDETLKESETLGESDECNDCICALENISSRALCKQPQEETIKQSAASTASTKLGEEKVSITPKASAMPVDVRAGSTKSQEVMSSNTPGTSKTSTNLKTATFSKCNVGATTKTSAADNTKCSNNQSLRQSKVESQRQIIESFLKELGPCKPCFKNETSFKPDPNVSIKSEKSNGKAAVSDSNCKVSKSDGSSRVKDELKEAKTRKSESSSLNKEKSSKTENNGKKGEAKQTGQGSLQDNKTAKTTIDGATNSKFKSSKASFGYSDLEKKRSQYSAEKGLKPKGEVTKYCSKVLQPSEYELVDDQPTCGIKRNCGCSSNTNQNAKVEIDLKASRSSQNSKSDSESKGNKSSAQGIKQRIENCNKVTQPNECDCKNADKDKKVRQPNQTNQDNGQNVCGDHKSEAPTCRTVIISKENHCKLIRCEPNVIVQYKKYSTFNGDCNCVRSSVEQKNSDEINPTQRPSINEFKPTCQTERGVFTCRTIYNRAHKNSKEKLASVASKVSAGNQNNIQEQAVELRSSDGSNTQKSPSKNAMNKISPLAVEMHVPRNSLASNNEKFSCNIKQKCLK